MYARNALVLAAAGLVAAQNTTPGSNSTAVATTTKVVTAYTTYCPGATTFDFNGKHYEIEEATTLTITDCPCTIVEPVPTTHSVCNGNGCVKTTTTTHAVAVASSTHSNPAVTPISTGTVVVTAGAGSVGVSLGLAAMVGLLAL